MVWWWGHYRLLLASSITTSTKKAYSFNMQPFSNDNSWDASAYLSPPKQLLPLLLQVFACRFALHSSLSASNLRCTSARTLKLGQKDTNIRKWKLVEHHHLMDWFKGHYGHWLTSLTSNRYIPINFGTRPWRFGLRWRILSKPPPRKGMYRNRQNYGKKKRFNLQAPPVYDRKVTNLFFSIIIFSIIICFSIILSVTVCPSIRNLNAF